MSCWDIRQRVLVAGVVCVNNSRPTEEGHQEQSEQGVGPSTRLRAATQIWSPFLARSAASGCDLPASETTRDESSMKSKRFGVQKV